MRIFKKWTKQSLSWSIWNFLGEMDEAPRGSESPVVWVIASKIHSSRWVTSFKKKNPMAVRASWLSRAGPSRQPKMSTYLAMHLFVCLSAVFWNLNSFFWVARAVRQDRKEPDGNVPQQQQQHTIRLRMDPRQLLRCQRLYSRGQD